MKYLCINCIFWELTFPTGVNLSVTASPCHLPYRGEALAYRKASPLRQRLPYKGSWRGACDETERLYEGQPARAPPQTSAEGFFFPSDMLYYNVF